MSFTVNQLQISHPSMTFTVVQLQIYRPHMTLIIVWLNNNNNNKTNKQTNKNRSSGSTKDRFAMISDLRRNIISSALFRSVSFIFFVTSPSPNIHLVSINHYRLLFTMAAGRGKTEILHPVLRCWLALSLIHIPAEVQHHSISIV